jgi:hypothetical protein
MAQTIGQQIATAEATLARLRKQNRELENGQKIILGGMLLSAARKDATIRKWLLDEAISSVKRPADVKRLAPLLDELRQEKNASPTPPPVSS